MTLGILYTIQTRHNIQVVKEVLRKGDKWQTENLDYESPTECP